ncbi:MAG: alpha-hydroxy-acid oxidizing protein [Gammaproteobacteria bacterium]|nr:alpha-hydroxy-acid oxidizing protein [Gammaproteobacteria bacterium]MDH4254486.1 alpha-hydroxy-acid oxidizing protein [Gammaproteobacteria bacterium]MDH5309090.1 alpha-hydroxy-acid oxidizing protein [Gammaproteobacteria bacterium]
MNDRVTDNARRAFLQFLAASPLYGSLAGVRAALADVAADAGEPVKTAAEAIDVFDLEATAAGLQPPAHWGYLMTGTNGDGTYRANRSAFDRYYLRSRRLVDVSGIDLRTTVFGQEWPTPIVLCPVGSQQAWHAEGELATARAAKERNHLQILSNVSSVAVEDVARARAAPVWQQLYPGNRWDVAEYLLRRAEAAGCPAVVLTVDLPASGNDRNTLERWIRRDTRDCAVCHEDPAIAGRPKPMYSGVAMSDDDLAQASLTWEFVDRLRNATDLKVLVKGIVTAEDAELCIRHGVDGIIVSNHGGRADDSGRGAIESLEEVAGAVQARVTLLMDSGIRRGTDILKALALGADAVCIGRPYIWGLGAFGQAGVDRALEILTNELRTAMEYAGTPALAAIGAGAVGRH